MISSVTDLSVPELDRPRSCDSSLDRKATGQILTCCASLDGSQCKICRSLISLSNSSQFNDSQSFSPKMKRDASSSLYSGVFSHALDPLVSPPASRGNTLKTLRSLTEEAEDGSLNSTDIYKDNDVNCMKKIVINRNVTENNLLCFPEDLPNEFYLCKEAFVTEEMWSSFIKQLNGIFFKISSFSEAIPPQLFFGEGDFYLHQFSQCIGASVFQLSSVLGEAECAAACVEFNCVAVNVVPLPDMTVNCEILTSLEAIVPANGMSCYAMPY
uniref:Anaphase-promoting complex subunit 1 n=1 Tax=Syphacia muris TaxID=451379 RepID=A0A0N5A9I8_9BILA